MKTVNLELSKQLKEAGYPQESSSYWWGWQAFKNAKLVYHHPERFNNKEDYIYASPTADELLEQLPCATQQKWFLISKNPNKEEWVIDYSTKNIMLKGDSLADAAAKCYLYLKKEGLI